MPGLNDAFLSSISVSCLFSNVLSVTSTLSIACFNVLSGISEFVISTVLLLHSETSTWFPLGSAMVDGSCFSASATKVSWHFDDCGTQTDALTSSLMSSKNKPRGLNFNEMGSLKHGLYNSRVWVFTIAFRALISVLEIKNGVLPGTMAMWRFTGPIGITIACRASSVLRFPKRKVTSQWLRYTLFFTSGCKALRRLPTSWLPITVFVAPLSRTPSALVDNSLAIQAVSHDGNKPSLAHDTAGKMLAVAASRFDCSLTVLPGLFLMRSWSTRARVCNERSASGLYLLLIRLRVSLSLSFASMDFTSTWKTTPSCRKESSMVWLPNSWRLRNSNGKLSGNSVTAMPVKFDPTVELAGPDPNVSLPLFGHSAFQWPRLPQRRQLLLRMRLWRFLRWPPRARFGFPFDPNFPRRPFPLAELCDEGKKPRCLNFSARRLRASV